MSDGEFSEEELESLAVNLGSLHPSQQQLAGQAGSDTEADFLDKCDNKNRARAYNENIADDKSSSGAHLDHLRDSKTSKVRLF